MPIGIIKFKTNRRKRYDGKPEKTRKSNRPLELIDKEETRQAFERFEFVPLDTLSDPRKNQLEMTGMSPHFDEIGEGEAIPEYQVRFKKSPDTGDIETRKVKRITALPTTTREKMIEKIEKIDRLFTSREASTDTPTFNIPHGEIPFVIIAEG
uniref:Uncharacterized protein n=1 Tax=Candidatus Kentrum sp. FM TaxID=2126340 RepID=A0A450VS78_9GAMM|nr:MAG: hypothetical protein BECKFM1743A_GA0114220_100442 [Candidatus Kentron sp. FM]VFJ47627.1 MAG: hypothetical protein BECKFM1743C_GA0114222_100481 [Candidatus Kentron sp. FM]VFK07644.1 MAG: hypothetical protein BECKFM1743B_GA0114221_100471 [Candidatus Kentron sp. FM]